MNIKIRPAQPEDADLIAWCMLMAGRSHMKTGIWDLVISQPEKKCLEFLKMLTLQGPRHMCRYTEFLVAEADGRVVAAIEGFDPFENGDATVAGPMAVVMEKIGLTEANMAPGQKSLEAFFTCHSEYEKGAWVIEQVAVLPEYREKGIISMLLEEILNKGRNQGFKLSQVSFYIGNTAAENVYKKAGFTYADEKRHSDFEAVIGCPGMIRFLKKI